MTENQIENVLIIGSGPAGDILLYYGVRHGQTGVQE